MKLVSMSKLTRAQEASRKAKFYAQHLTDLLGRLTATADVREHPLLHSENHKNRALILLMTSDRGLCGGFNNNLFRAINGWLSDNSSSYQEIDLCICGRRGYTYFKSKYKDAVYYPDVTTHPDFNAARKIGNDLSTHFLNGEYRDIFIAYNKFLTPLSQKPAFEKLLPISPQPLLSNQAPLSMNYLFEPDVNKLVSFLVPRHLYFMIYYALLENSAGEHAARMTAMESATRNTEDLITRLTMIRNRARQAGITAQLIEIVSGSEALNQ